MEYVETIRNLETSHGAKWRKSAADRKLFSRRKQIYHSIERLINSGFQENDAVLAIESRRIRENWSIDKLQKNI